MTPEQFTAELEKLLSEMPKGVPPDDCIDLAMELVERSVVAAHGISAHVTLFVGTRLEQVTTRTTLTDKQLMSLLMAFCEAKALQHTPTPEKGS